jgi:hypothetical protein
MNKNAEISPSSPMLTKVHHPEELFKTAEYIYQINQGDIRNYFSQINSEEIESDVNPLLYNQSGQVQITIYDMHNL